MGGLCASSRKDIEIQEDRLFNDVIIEGVYCELDEKRDAQALLNLDVDPKNSELKKFYEQYIKRAAENDEEKVGLLKNEENNEKEQDREKQQQNEDEARWDDGLATIEKFPQPIIKNTSYVIHFRVGVNFSEESLKDSYITAFKAANQAQIVQLTITDHFFNNNKLKIDKKQHAQIIFKSIISYLEDEENNHIKHFLVIAKEKDSAYTLVDSFLAIYNMSVSHKKIDYDKIITKNDELIVEDEKKEINEIDEEQNKAKEKTD